MLAILCALLATALPSPNPNQDAAAEVRVRRSCCIVGVLLDGSGEPLEAVTLTLEEGGGGGRRGAGADWMPGAAGGGVGGWTAVTDSAGRFEVGFEASSVLHYSLVCRGGGLEPLEWRIPGSVTGSPIDLGELRRKRSEALEIRVLDAEGAPTGALGAVTVKGRRPAGPYRVAFSTALRTGSGPGPLEIGELPTGPLQVEVEFDFVAGTHAQSVEVEPGERARLAVTYGGPDTRRAVVIEPDSELMHPMLMPAPASCVLVDAAGVVRAFESAPREVWERERGPWIVSDLPPGEYSVRFRDSRFLPVVLSGVQPGEVHALELVGSGRLEVELHGAGGEPYEGPLSVRAQSLDDQRRPLRWLPTVPLTWTPRPGGGLVTGVFPVPQQLLFEAGAAGKEEFGLIGLSPGETRPLRVDLWLGERLAGRVVEADGRPVAGARVQARAPSGDWDYFGSALVAATTTDANGGFELERTYRAQVLYEICPPGQRRVVFRGREKLLGSPDWPEIRLPEPGRLTGKVKLPASGLPVSASLHLERENEVTGRNSMQFWADTCDARDVPVGSAGEYSIKDLGPGVYVVWLERPANRTSNSSGMSTVPSWPRNEAFATIEMAPGGTVHLDLDLSQELVPKLALRFTSASVPVSELQIDLEIESGPNTLTLRSRTDKDGLVVFKDLPPGRARAWTYLTLDETGDPEDSDWNWGRVATEPFELRPAASLSLQRSIELRRGKLTLEDESGQPLVGLHVRLQGAEISGGPIDVVDLKTGAGGALDLVLPEGRYQLRLLHPGRELDELVWPPEGGRGTIRCVL